MSACTTSMSRVVRRNPALFGMPALLIAALATTVLIHPTFSDFDLESLAMGALPLALAAAAQAVVVIAGGIDLSIGSMIAVANVLAARSMEHASFEQSLLLAVAVVLAGAAMGAVNGLIVVFSRVPDVVATLTSGFIWGGVALLILEKPGGGAPPEFLNLGAGTTFSTWLPNGLILLAVSVAVIWTPLSRSKLGLRALRHRKRPQCGVPQRGWRPTGAGCVLHLFRRVQRRRGPRPDDDDRHRRSARRRLLHTERPRRHRGRRRKPRGRPRRPRRAQCSRRLC